LIWIPGIWGYGHIPISPVSLQGGKMKRLGVLVGKLGSLMDTVGGVALSIMMMLTVVDIVLRMFNKPIVGTYELVAVLSAITIGFAIPPTSLDRGHIYVDFMLEHCPDALRKGILIFTRVLGIVLMALLAWHLFLKAGFLYRGGDVSQTLHVPYYPVAYALSLCMFVECIVLIKDLTNILNKKGEGNE
jgi:TRAP-type C4-dicarboxylate transport system permease small subunit